MESGNGNGNGNEGMGTWKWKWHYTSGCSILGMFLFRLLLLNIFNLRSVEIITHTLCDKIKMYLKFSYIIENTRKSSISPYKQRVI